MPYRYVYAILVKMAAITLLAGCAERGAMGYLEASQQAQNLQTILVASNRVRTVDGGFGRGRSHSVSYASYDISIPDAHLPGQLEWPHKKINPAKDMAIAAQHNFVSAASFKTRLNRTLKAEKSNKNVQVFIHGFNNNFAESLYRLAQLKHDYEENSPTVLYSWPSAANPRLYIYDRDSVLSARDGLVEMLTLLGNSDAQKITLTAHSMGAQLLMEALRQIYLTGNKRLRAKIGAVILLSPDIDVDLFNSQVAHLTPLPQPFLVLGSTQDHALRFMSWLAGEPKRVGNDLNPAGIENKKIRFFDLSRFTDGDKANHFLLATSPTLLAMIKKDFARLGSILPTFNAVQAHPEERP